MKKIKLIILLQLLTFTIVGWASSDSQTELFRQANAAYDSGNYEQAVELYNTIVDNGFDSWELRYNLGNAYYRLDNVGQSILNYERALRMAPGKKNIKDNLALARSHTTDNIEELPKLFLVEWANAVVRIMTLKGWLTTVAILFLLGCAATFVVPNTNSSLLKLY